MQFFRACGGNVAVSEDGRTATRRSARDFNNGVVFGDRPLSQGKVVTVSLLNVDKDWSGGVKLGVVATAPWNLGTPYTCLSLEGDSWILLGDSVLHNGLIRIREYGPNLDDLEKDDRIGLLRTRDNKLEVFFNGRSLGVAARNLPRSVFLVVELYGKCAGVGLTEEAVDVGVCRRDGRRVLAPLQNSNQGPSASSSLSGAAGSSASVNGVGVGPVRFHQCRGVNVVLVSGRSVARRTIADRDYANGVVLTDRPLGVDELFLVEIVSQVTKWTGNVEIGVCSRNPNSLSGQLPSTMTKLASGVVMLSSSSILIDGKNGLVDYSSVDLDDLQEGDSVGVVVKSTGYLHFWVGGVDQGPAVKMDLRTPLWGVVDMFGKTCEVKIVPSHVPSVVARPPDRAADSSRQRLPRSEDLLFEELRELDDDDEDENVSGGDVDDADEEDDDDDDTLSDSSPVRPSAGGRAPIIHSEDEDDDDEDDGGGNERDRLPFIDEDDDVEEDDEDAAEERDADGGRGMRLSGVVRGPNVVVCADGRSAYRPRPEHHFNQALVVCQSPMRVDDLLSIRVEEVEHKWIGSMEIGLIGTDPRKMLPPWPHSLADVCGDVWMLSGCVLTKNGTTLSASYRLDLDAIDEGSKISLQLDSNGSVKFFLDGRDQGIAFTGLPQRLWVAVDLYGKCSKISLVDSSPDCIYDESVREEERLRLRRSRLGIGRAADLLGLDSDDEDGYNSFLQMLDREDEDDDVDVDLDVDLEDLEEDSERSGSDVRYNCFDPVCGDNVVLSEDGARAKRVCSFNNALLFSKHPLLESYPFSFRIEKVDTRWPGTLKVGVMRKCAGGPSPREQLPPDITSMRRTPRWADGYALWSGSKTLVAPFGEKLLRPTVGMVVGVICNPGGVYLTVNGRSVGALTLEATASERIAVVDLFGPVTEVRCMNDPKAWAEFRSGRRQGWDFGSILRPLRGGQRRVWLRRLEGGEAGSKGVGPSPVFRHPNGDLKLVPVSSLTEDGRASANVALVDGGKRAFRFVGPGSAWLALSLPLVPDMPLKIKIEGVNASWESSLVIGAFCCEAGRGLKELESNPVSYLLASESGITVAKNLIMQTICKNAESPGMVGSLEQIKTGDSIVVMVDKDFYLYLFGNGRGWGRSLLPVAKLSAMEPCCTYGGLHAAEAKGVESELILVLDLYGRCVQISLADMDNSSDGKERLLR